jgi:DNA-binding MarR family transcriptional regulator
LPVTTGIGLADPIEVCPQVPLQDVTTDLTSEQLGVGGSIVVVEALNRAAAAVRHHVEHAVLRGADLSWTGYAVLTLTCDERSVETRAAAAAIGISRGTLTGVVRTLESKNLISRVPHCHDGRLVLLEPTTAGRRLARRLAPRVAEAEEFALSCLNGGERDALTGLLGRVVADLNFD